MLNACPTLHGTEPGLPARLGRDSMLMLPVLAGLPLSTIVYGRPLWRVKMAPNCQPP